VERGAHDLREQTTFCIQCGMSLGSVIDAVHEEIYRRKQIRVDDPVLHAKRVAKKEAAREHMRQMYKTRRAKGAVAKNDATECTGSLPAASSK
jgi:hypothetical protein